MDIIRSRNIVRLQMIGLTDLFLIVRRGVVEETIGGVGCVRFPGIEIGQVGRLLANHQIPML
jgi:hypothetical protein